MKKSRENEKKEAPGLICHGGDLAAELVRPSRRPDLLKSPPRQVWMRRRKFRALLDEREEKFSTPTKISPKSAES